MKPLMWITGSLERNHLHPHFKAWASSSERAKRAGAPRWLERIAGWNTSTRLRHPCQGGGTIDCLGTDGDVNFVVELKYASKYEPFALAECLHYIEMLGHERVEPASEWTPGKMIVPVVIGQMNCAMRTTVRYLRGNFPANYPNHLRFVEVAALGTSPGEPELWWFSEYSLDNPECVGTTKPDEIPDDIAGFLRKKQLGCWHRRADGTGWIVTPPDSAEVKGHEPHAWCARLLDGTRWLLWLGDSEWQGGSYWLYDG